MVIKTGINEVSSEEKIHDQLQEMTVQLNSFSMHYNSAADMYTANLLFYSVLTCIVS